MANILIQVYKQNIYNNICIFCHVSYHIIGDKKDDVQKYTEKAVERVDENGVKYIVYEEKSVDIDEDAEVSV